MNWQITTSMIWLRIDRLASLCVVYWPSTRPKTWKLHVPLTLAGLADKMGQGKIPRYSHRLMHRKRVTCSTMGVGCQSRRFNCLFWRETRQRILGHEISPYPEVVRGGEGELTTRPRERQLVVGGAEVVGGWRAERQAAEEKLAWKNGGTVNTRHRAERRGDKIGSSEEESQDVWFQ